MLYWLIALGVVLVFLFLWATVKIGAEADELNERIRAHEKEGMQ